MLFEIFVFIYLGISSYINGYTLTTFKEERAIAFLLSGKQSEIQCIMRAPSKPALPLAQHRLADNKVETKNGHSSTYPSACQLASVSLWHQCIRQG